MLEDHLGGHAGYTHLDEGALDFVKDMLQVQSMLDIGCGPGGMVELANQKKINAIGIDGDYTLNRYDDSKFIIHDFTKGPIKKIKPKQFDLAWSVEFVEHVYEKYIPHYMPSFQRCKYVIMTYAPPGWPGHHHVNCQPETYWIKKFTDYGFTYDQGLTKMLRSKSSMRKPGKTGVKGAYVKKRGLLFRK